MKARHLKFLAVLLAAFTLIGCDQGQKAPAKTRVHVVNAAPHFAQLWYQREHPTTEAPEALTFKTVTAHDYDVDTYDFFVYHERVGTGEILDTWTWIKQLAAYTRRRGRCRSDPRSPLRTTSPLRTLQRHGHSRHSA